MQLHILLLFLAVTVLLSSPTWAAAGGEDQAVASQEVNPLHYNCSLSGGKYEPNSTYEANLRALASLLLAEARATAFASDSFGAAPDAVYGIALCRGDYAGDACAGGLRKAFRDAIDHGVFCAGFRDVTVYYDEHMFRFSGEDFRASLTNAPAWVTWNMNGVAGAAAFGDRVMELINTTAEFAAWNSSKRGYATGEAGFGELDVGATRLGLVEQQCRSSPDLVIFALVQCTPDLSPAGCLSCLAGIASQMPRWFAGAADYRLGGRILGVRCNLRYEVDRFFLESNETIKIHMPKQKGGMSKTDIALITISGVVTPVLPLILIGFIVKKIRDCKLRRELGDWEKTVTEEIDERFSLYPFSMIRDATENFSAENRLGHGSFGQVYRGILQNGLQIAAKRLDQTTWQGLEEFLNEIRIIIRLQHANLVRLLGCCVNRKEQILVYEYMPNRSLDYVLSDRERGASLSWFMRRHIINGIAQGLDYLHNHAPEGLIIIHRDMKLSNILLDSENNPKISDFGIARKFCLNGTEPYVTHPVGTPGYMAPEYIHGDLTPKYDVFSFDVLVLEIISGRRVRSPIFNQHGRSIHLLTYAWNIWSNRRYNELLDPYLRVEFQEELTRQIQIALLCVQKNPGDRPDMHEVTMWLSNNGLGLSEPQEPAYLNVPLGYNDDFVTARPDLEAGIIELQ
uniref:Protein kinase domain-containing protein n=1 Tax=Oryza nivara TaxID=4536 RepID=A0A0E0FHS0_ORYNI